MKTKTLILSILFVFLSTCVMYGQNKSQQPNVREVKYKLIKTDSSNVRQNGMDAVKYIHTYRGNDGRVIRQTSYLYKKVKCTKTCKDK